LENLRIPQRRIIYSLQTTITRQAMYLQRNTEGRSRNHGCRAKAIIIYIMSVCLYS